MRCTENCNSCSQHWPTEWPQFFSTIMPDRTLHTSRTTNASKVERVGLQNLDSSFILTWPLANQLPLLQASQLLAGKTLPQPAGGRKCFTRVCRIPKHGFLRYRNKSLYFSLAKNVLTLMVPILINKYVFEPSYNNLKFKVWNHNYFATNLIKKNLEPGAQSQPWGTTRWRHWHPPEIVSWGGHPRVPWRSLCRGRQLRHGWEEHPGSHCGRRGVGG